LMRWRLRPRRAERFAPNPPTPATGRSELAELMRRALGRFARLSLRWSRGALLSQANSSRR
jgi:hypothetical protein